MNGPFADAFGRVILEYLRFEGRVAAGSPPGLEEARGRFIEAVDGLETLSRSAQGRDDDVRLIRCALVCWVDEMLTLHSGWAEHARFRARCLEIHYPEVHELPGTSEPKNRPPVDGPRLFYEAAELAKARPEPDAIEAFLACVALGFRGRHRREERLREWVEQARNHLKARRRHDDPPGPAPAGVGPMPLLGDDLRLWTAALVAISALVTLASFIVAVHVRPY